MKIKVLGSSAGEGLPGIFCHCATCEQARKRGGKNIRTRMQVLVNDDLIIDYPCDTYMHVLNNKFDISAVKYYLITHTHSDHYYEREFCMRGWPYAMNLTEERVSIYCGELAYNKFYVNDKYDWSDEIRASYDLNKVDDFETFSFGDYEVTALPAEHSVANSLLYLIRNKGKTYFHCSDTGILYEKNFDWMVENKVHIDCIAMDSTMGKLTLGKGKGHMGYGDCLYLKNRLISLGICDENTKFVLIHFSHFGEMLHEDYEELCKKDGMIPSYDGMEIEI